MAASKSRGESLMSRTIARSLAGAVMCLLVVLAFKLPAPAPLAAAGPSGPTAPLPQPKDISCGGRERDTVVLYWIDEAPDETEWRVERNIGGAGWSQVATLPANTGTWTDTGADVSTQNRQYRVRSFRSGDSANSPYSDVCNNRRIYENGPFRIFYGLRGTTDDCPLTSGQQVCTGNVSFVNTQGDAMQGARSAFQRVGFALDAGVPPGSLDKIPINVVWCDSGGCAGGGGMGLSPWLIEFPFDRTTRVGDPGAYIVAEHELFHFLQFRYGWLSEPAGGWVYEGQARSTQDKICLGADRSTAWCFDDIATGFAGYVPEVNGYLGNTNVGLRLAEYQAALFWTYLTEKYGTSAPADLTEGGMNLMVEFWEEAAATPGRDAVTVLNSALSTLGAGTNFKNIYKDFVIANVGKDLNGAGVPAVYKYADMAQPGGTYAPVMYTISQTLPLGGSVLDTDETVNPWGARYYQVRPAADVPVIPIKVTQDTLTPLFYVVLGIKADTIAFEQRFEQRDLDLTLVNDAYERVVVIVAGLDNLGNYRISLNGTQPQLRILSPTNSNRARVGPPGAPEKFLAQVEVVDGEGVPLAGIDLANFSFQIGSRAVPPANIVASAAIQGQHWFVIQAVTQTFASSYDLTVRYSTILTGTQLQAINYIARTNADNVLVIDTSGSMGDNSKLASAQQAGRLYVDSWRTGDKIAVESFNDTPSVDMQLTDWTDTPGGGSRETAFTTISGYTALGGTAIGDALLAGWEELKARGLATHDWALILLSDGEETAGTVSFTDAVNTIAGSTGKKPVIHTVAVGPDADRLRMQNAAMATGGTYQYVSAPAGTLLASASALTLADDVTMMPLNLAAKYSAIATYVLGHQQFFSQFGPLDPNVTFESMPIVVESNASEMVISISWLPELESVQLTDPLSNTVPFFEIDATHKVWRVATPAAGTWHLTVDGQNQGPGGKLPYYFVHGSLKSQVMLNAFIDTPLPDRVPGAPEHIVALLTDQAAILGAAVTAEVTRPDGGVSVITLHDDGAHGDGAADDGVYGQNYYYTGLAGSYNVLVKADGSSALSGAFHREALLAFHLDGETLDLDQDELPDEWEKHFPCLPVGEYDPEGDPDNDDSPNIKEYERGTDPCNPDTDGDGEADGTDDQPTEPDSDRVKAPWAVVWPGIHRAWLKYTLDPIYQRIVIYRRLVSPTLAQVVALGPMAVQADDQLIGIDEPPTGVFTDTTALNDQTYCYFAVAETFDGQRSTALSPTCTTPKDDPAPPHGGLAINEGQAATLVPQVTLYLLALDKVDPHLETDYGAAFMTPPAGSASGVTNMMVCQRSDMQGCVWEAYAPTRPWTLDTSQGLASVFAKYRDAAGNESDVYAATIHVGPGSPGLHYVHLPMVAR